MSECIGSAKDFDGIVDCLFGKLADVAEGIVFYSKDVTITAPDGVISEHTLPLIIVWLAAASIFFTFYLGFANFRFFKHALQVVSGKFDKEKSDGEVSSFQALTASLSGTVGLGNIAGVAIAISIGGPGAVVWMTIMGLMGMNTKFAEVMLGVKYRGHHDPENPEAVQGGPMYYLKHAFTKRGFPELGTIVAVFFALCCIGGAIGAGNMFQSNQAYGQIVGITGGEASYFADKGWLVGLIMAFFAGLVILGGLKSIASVASRLVPLMGGIYLLAGLIVIAMNYTAIGGAFATILGEAINPSAGLGGLVGALLVGVQRASFSNEAGLGSAAIVHAAAKTKYPVRQGLVGMLGPFIDTVVICNVTALVIVITGAYVGSEGMAGVEMTSQAFGSAVSWFPYVLTLTVVLFAFSTIITWYYYGEKALAYIVGEKQSIKFCLKMVFLFAIVLGASAELTNVIRFTDAMILSMGIPNIIGLYLLAPEIKEDLKAYCKKFCK